MVIQNGQSVVVALATEPHSQEPQETTPLNQGRSPRNRDNNSDSSSAVTSDRSSRKFLDANTMDGQTKTILIKIGIDFVLLCCVGFPILIFFLIGEPYERGFFCNDESLMHPFHDSTVRHWMLYIVGLGLPVVTITATELLRCKFNIDDDQSIKFFGKDIPAWIQRLYKYIGVFAFGAACSQLTTDIGKYSIGRLRPHFISVCRPLLPDGTTCDDPKNAHKYIETFTCGNTESTARMIKEMRLSFPSGHSSFSFYTLIFCTLYLQSRMCWRGSKLLKHFLQFLFISMAWYTALSRISDYKHHWSDVLAGSLLGITVALLIVRGVSDLFKRKKCEGKLPTTRYELNTQNHNGNNN